MPLVNSLTRLPALSLKFEGYSLKTWNANRMKAGWKLEPWDAGTSDPSILWSIELAFKEPLPEDVT